MWYGWPCAMSDESKSVSAILENAPVLGWFWFLFMAAWGGLVGYMRKVKRKKAPFAFREMFGEVFISAFSGIVTAYICVWMNMPFVFTAAAAGVAGHLGGAAIDLLEGKFRGMFEK